MIRFCVKYRDPETGEMAEKEAEFSDWTGRAEGADGVPFGKVVTITAREWAEDYAYMLADKNMGDVTITELRS